MGVDLMGGHCLEGVDPGFSKGGGAGTWRRGGGVSHSVQTIYSSTM